jgi:hypothetical protein
MDKELIDQLWNRATRETLNSGALNERYRFAQLVAYQALTYGPSYQTGYQDATVWEREQCAKACELTLVAFGQGAADWNEAVNACAAAIRARGND